MLYDLWIIDDFESYNTDPQYSGFVIVDSLTKQELSLVQGACNDKGLVTVIVPKGE